MTLFAPQRHAATRTHWLVALCCSIGLSAAQAAEPEVAYMVRPGDTLIGLGQQVLIAPSAWPEVAKRNRLPDANRIRPGQVLQIPSRLLRSEPVAAELLNVEGSVQIDGRAAAAGAALRTGERLSTAGNSSAVVRLADGSRVLVAPDGELQLSEHRRYALRAGDASADGTSPGLLASALHLVRGSVELFATKVLRAKPLEVSTPTAVIGVRGTEYRVHADAGLPTRTEVLEGRVQATPAEAMAAGVSLAAGQGAAISANSPPTVVALQAPPPLTGLSTLFERPLVRFKVQGETLPLRVQVAADAEFQRVVRDERLAPGAEVRVAGLEDGAWFLRLRRIDALGVEGRDANLAFRLKARPEPPAAAAPSPGARLPVGTVRLAWAENTEASHYRLEVARDPAFAEVVHRQDAVRGAEASLSLGEPGNYFWRAASVRAQGDQGPWSDAQGFELKALPEPPKGGVNAEGGIELNWGGRAEDRQQVQLARDPAFEQLAASAELSSSRWSLERPATPGTYYFRYRSVEPDGYITPWSSTLKLEVPRDWRFLWLLSPLLLAL
ncbi:FecR domain-containing protein [Ideonella sp.]|uniref:FecR domain-containing protein n=1 Tax=Ideonella sp. TaxID=1929293 RepID=UPI003BB52769